MFAMILVTSDTVKIPLNSTPKQNLPFMNIIFKTNKYNKTLTINTHIFHIYFLDFTTHSSKKLPKSKSKTPFIVLIFYLTTN